MATVRVHVSSNCVHIAESVGSHRELVANSCTHRRRDATPQFRRVGGVNFMNWPIVGSGFGKESIVAVHPHGV